MDVSDIFDRLSIVPNLISTDIFDRIDLKHLIDDQIVEGTDDPFKLTKSNLIAVAHYLLDQLDDCEAINEQILAEHPRNINANCTKIFLLFEAKQFTDAESRIQYLEDLKSDDQLIVEAEADIAFIFSCIGPAYNMAAIRQYTDLIDKNPEMYEWKFRLALVRRRCQHPSVHVQLPVKLCLTENFKICKELFEEVVEKSPSKLLKAASLVQMAVLFHERNWREVNFEKLGIDVSKREDLIEEYIAKAFDLNALNILTLQDAGRILRSIGRYESARKILKLVVMAHPTETAKHHLALTIQKLEGNTPEVIKYLEESYNDGANPVAMIDLGRAYIELEQFDNAIECFTKATGSSDYSLVRQSYDHLVNCYTSKAKQPDVFGLRKYEMHGKAYEMNKKCIMYGLLAHLKNTQSGERKKLTRQELFPPSLSVTKVFDFTCPTQQLIKAVRKFRGKTEFLRHMERLLDSANLDDIQTSIEKHMKQKKYEACLEMVMFLMVTDINGIEMVGVDSILRIVEIDTEFSEEDLSETCFMYLMNYFYSVDETIGHIRIIFEEESNTEAVLVESWLEDLDLIVTRNDEDVPKYVKRPESLIEALTGNVAVLIFIKGNNCDLLEDYPLNMLPPNLPHIIPVLTDKNSKIPESLKDYQALRYPDTGMPDKHAKALFLKQLGEIIFHATDPQQSQEASD